MFYDFCMYKILSIVYTHQQMNCLLSSTSQTAIPLDSHSTNVLLYLYQAYNLMLQFPKYSCMFHGLFFKHVFFKRSRREEVIIMNRYKVKAKSLKNYNNSRGLSYIVLY